MDESRTSAEPLAPTGAAPELRISADPNGEPHAFEAATAYIAEFDDWVIRLATYPAQRWVAYRGRQRGGFGTEHFALLRECSANFPNGLFKVYYIDPMLAYQDETVL